MGLDVTPAELLKFLRGNPPDEPERFYRLTRDGRWKRGETELKVRRLRNKPVALHGRVRRGITGGA